MVTPQENPLDLIERLISTPPGSGSTAARYALVGSLLPMLMTLDRRAMQSDPAARDELGILFGTCGIACFDYYDQFGDALAAGAAQSAFDACAAERSGLRGECCWSPLSGSYDQGK